MIEREKFIKKSVWITRRRRSKKKTFCVSGQKFSKPTQMFSVSVLEIFLDTKSKFYMFSFSRLLYIFFFGQPISGIRKMNRKKSVQTPFTKDKLKFLLAFSFLFFKYHKISFSCVSLFHVNFMSDFFQMLFLSFSFLLLVSGRTLLQQIKTRHQPPWTRE